MQFILSKWKQRIAKDFNSQIFNAALTVALMTVLVKIASISKELVVAWRFGTGDELDAFFIAWLVPSLLIVVLADSFNGALLPIFIQVREQEGYQSAQKLLSSVVVLSLAFLSITTVLMVVTAPIYLPLIAKGFSSEKLVLTRQLLILIAPIVPLSGVAVIWGTIFLNAGERFAGAALAPIITPLISIFFLLFCKQVSIFALPLGFVCGAMIEVGFLGMVLRKQGFSLFPKWQGFNRHLRYCTKQHLPTAKIKELGIGGETGYIEKNPYPDNFFDIVFCSEVLEHLSKEQINLGLLEIKRVLITVGLLIGTVPHNENLLINQVVCPCCGKVFHRWGHLQSFNLSTLSQIFDRVLRLENIKTIYFPIWSRNWKGNLTSLGKKIMSVLGIHGSEEHLFFIARK